MIDKSLLMRAIEKWGDDLQIDLCQEECAELITALAHQRRGRTNANEDVIEEIADVTIMVKQMAMIFGEDKVDAVIDQKQARLRYRLDHSQFENAEVKK